MNLLKKFDLRNPPGTKERQTPKHNYCVFNRTEESFLGLNITRADTSLARLRGLLGKAAPKSGDGMWFAPSQGIHTIGIFFHVDLVYLDNENRVIHLVEHLGPFRIGPLRLKAATVLELPTHAIYRSQTRVGHQLLICHPEEMSMYLGRSSAPGKLKSAQRAGGGIR